MNLVTEVCPSCENEITMQWDVDADGLKAFCPVCGERLMLCDECQHRTDGIYCDYDSVNDTCRFNLKRFTVKIVESYAKYVCIDARRASEAVEYAKKLNRSGKLDGMDLEYDGATTQINTSTPTKHDTIFSVNDEEDK